MRLYVNLSRGWPNRWARLKWQINQLVPLTYRSRYKDEKDRMHFCVWRMWFGRCFAIEEVILEPRRVE